ncbi:UPF0280 family protein [Bacteroidota bacterium]
MIQHMYEPRFYRHQFNSDQFVYFNIVYKETDIFLGIDVADSDIDQIKIFSENYIFDLRNELEDYIKINADFNTSLIPIDFDKNAPEIAQQMMYATQKPGTGPMAAVAGAFSEFLGKAIIDNFNINELIIENGGDIFLKNNTDKVISIYAGNSPLSEKVGLVIPSKFSNLGICTSAGTFGHSFSFGEADAVMIACESTLIADAYATAFGNIIYNEDMIDPIINKVKSVSEILSCVIIKGEKMGVCGQLEIKPL